jgi:Flp pilus assembly pilin Flp
MYARWQRLRTGGIGPTTDECGAIAALVTITLITIATTLGINF